MAEYRYYLIPDAMTRAFPEKFEKQTPTEFFDNIADLEKRYQQLREMPYNNERTWNERARFPYARLVVGVDRQNPDGARKPCSFSSFSIRLSLSGVAASTR